MAEVQIVYECATCWARSPGVRGQAGEPMGTAGRDECRRIEHRAIIHPLGVTYRRFEFPVLDAPSPGLFEAPDE